MKSINEVSKIIYTGTHGSGKTTIQRKYMNLEHYGIVSFDELIRHLKRIPNFRFTPGNDEMSRMQYANTERALVSFYKSICDMKNAIPNQELIVMDRCILDPLYYTSYFNINVKMANDNLWLSDVLINEILEVKRLGFFNNAKIFLLNPLPLDEEDTFRIGSQNTEEFYKIQHDIYNTAKRTLQLFHLPFEECNQQFAFEESHFIAKNIISSKVAHNFNTKEQASIEAENILQNTYKSNEFKYNDENFILEMQKKGFIEGTLEYMYEKGKWDTMKLFEKGVI